MMEQLKAFLQEEDGIGVVEVILILVVLIALVAIFKDRITALVQDIFRSIVKEAGKDFLHNFRSIYTISAPFRLLSVTL